MVKKGKNYFFEKIKHLCKKHLKADSLIKSRKLQNSLKGSQTPESPPSSGQKYSSTPTTSNSTSSQRKLDELLQDDVSNSVVK